MAPLGQDMENEEEGRVKDSPEGRVTSSQVRRSEKAREGPWQGWAGGRGKGRDWQQELDKCLRWKTTGKVAVIWESIDERVFSPTYRIQSLKFYSMNQIDYRHCVAMKTIIIIHSPNNKNIVRYIHSVPCLKPSQGFRQRLTAVFWTKHLLIIKNMHKKLKFNGFSLFPHT